MGKPQDVLVPRTIASLTCFTEWDIHRRSGLTRVRAPDRLGTRLVLMSAPGLLLLLLRPLPPSFPSLSRGHIILDTLKASGVNG
jgi:hypothetical protein